MIRRDFFRNIGVLAAGAVAMVVTEKADGIIDPEVPGISSSDPDLQIGDIVFLNSGSPPMRVVRLARPVLSEVEKQSVGCKWKDSSGVSQYTVYPRVCLTYSGSGVRRSAFMEPKL
jgi:uncharacterized protein YodC (DUF2158 family)